MFHLNPVYSHRVRYTLTRPDGQTYDLVCLVTVTVDEAAKSVVVTFRPELDEFRVEAIGVLLVDLRTIYLDASRERSLPPLSEHTKLELEAVLDPADVAWMEQQAWLLGVELEICQVEPDEAAA